MLPTKVQVLADTDRVLEAGDLLTGRVGGLGQFAVYEDEAPASFSDNTLRLRLKGLHRQRARFIAEFLNSQPGRVQLLRDSRGGLQKVVTQESVGRIVIPDLGASEARLVAELDAARAERDRALAEAEELLARFEAWALDTMGVRQANPVQRKAFAVRAGSALKRLDPFHHSPAFIEIERAITSVPHVRVGDVAVFSSDTWSPGDHPDPTFRYIEISGVDRRRGKAVAVEVRTEEAPSRARMAVQPGDLIVSLTRPHHGSIALLGPEHAGCVASTGFSVIRQVSDCTTAAFLWVVLRLSYSLQQMLRRASGGNYPAITQDELANIVVPLPDKRIQTRIVDEAISRSEKADALEQHAETLWQQARERFEQQLLQGAPA
ncbi:MAG: restriction endonuclease subunit S [Caldimonas sp.]|uniref:restriction endonuclease subunit S n=1 Tax=Caldimonas sp. TaxID=2838790 RepID=UPI003919C4F0